MADMQHQTMIVWLAGGLGNQLFQFAFGRAISIKTGANVLFDSSAYHRPDQDRRYVLDKFGLKLPLIQQNVNINFDKGEVNVRSPRSFNFLKSTSERKFRLYPERKNFCFEPEAFNPRVDSYFRGYWQAHQYLADCNDTIVAEIHLPFFDLDEVGHGWLARIQNTAAVGVHVRRGDYLNPHTHSYHGLCDVRYYRAAIALLRRRLPAAEFFVFSDDPAWCRQALFDDQVYVIDLHPPDLGHLDLALMASCRHHIIANSSFSWWAAWLARHHAQIVVAPTPWTTQDGPTPDLFPAEWIVLDRATGESPVPHQL